MNYFISLRITIVALILFNGLGCKKEIIRSSHADITADELRDHVRYLASDALEGRRTGMSGANKAAEYVAGEFARYGLRPLGENGTYFQYYEVVTDIKLGKYNALKVQSANKILNFTAERDFLPLPFSSDTSVSGGLIFAGYGISSDSLKFDDYKELDVRGKIVMILRFAPDYGTHDSKFYSFAPLHKKAFIAREKGAAGIIFVTGPADDDSTALIPLRLDREAGTSGIPAVQLKAVLTDSLLKLLGIQEKLREIQQTIYDLSTPKSFEIPGVTVTLQTDLQRVISRAQNVVGILDGSDERLKNEAIIVGAHFDHLGYGGEGSGSLSPSLHAIHNGADDNASGTAAMLELAQAFTSRPFSMKRSLVFIAFSGEELGLLGSAYYVKNPAVSLNQTSAMVNLDMVGRMRDSSLTVEGLGTSPVWRPILEREDSSFHFKLKLGEGGFGPSDHSSFYGKNIPNLFFFTGTHEDYHKPSDDWEKINYAGMETVTRFVYNVVHALDNESRPQFTQVQATSDEPRRGFRVSFGIIPDYSEDEDGLKISGTRPESPAAKAGLKSEDVIIQFAGKKVKSIYDFTYLLEDRKPGDQVKVVFRRGSETLTVTATLEARK